MLARRRRLRTDGRRLRPLSPVVTGAQLARTHPGAAGSLREGTEETLTLTRLGIRGSLKRTLESTNPCESMIEIARRTRRSVKRWSSDEMTCWVMASLRATISEGKSDGVALEPALGTNNPMKLSHANIVSDYAAFGYVAHAFGEVARQWYSNSSEAFQASYRAGFRLFEADLLLLEDGAAVVAHDGLEKSYGLHKRFHEATWEEVRGLHFMLPGASDTRLSPIMNLQQLATLMEQHPDAYLVTDTKATRRGDEHLRILEQLASVAPPHVLDRVFRILATLRSLSC